MFKYIILIFFLSCELFSITLQKAILLINLNNKTIKSYQYKIEQGRKDEKLSLIWKNPSIGFGMNDLLINDISARDKEAMQTQFITFSQTIPTGDKLELKNKISKDLTIINKLKLKDIKYKYKALLNQYFNQFIITKQKIKLIEDYEQNVKKMKDILINIFQSGNSNQINILKNTIKEHELYIKKEKLIYKLKLLKLKIENIIFSKVENIEHSLVAYNNNINIDDAVKNHPLLQIYQYKIKQIQHKIKLTNSEKFGDIKLNVGYYQREKFDDYMAFNINIPLAIYKKEDIKISKLRHQLIATQNQLEQLKNDFQTTIKQLLIKRDMLYKNYKTITTKIISQIEQIGDILKSKSSINDTNADKFIKNLNNNIKQKLRALDELEQYYIVVSKLKYYIK